MSGINSITGRADINQVLAEMRAVRQQVQQNNGVEPSINPNQIQPSTQVNAVKETPSFNDLLSNAVNSVNESQQATGKLRTAYEMGDPNVSISQVMIQSQKSSVAFQALTQVRNRVVQAYEDIMKMPV